MLLFQRIKENFPKVADLQKIKIRSEKKMKKKALFSVLIFAMILTLAASLPLAAGAAEKNIKLRLSSVAAGPGQFPNSDSVKWWMDKVTEKTKGQVTFQSHWGASLAPPAGHIDLLEKGMVEVILGCRIYTPGKFPLGAFEYIFPFGPLDSHMVLQAKRQLYEEIPGFRDELAKANALLISNFSTMPYDICSKTPIQKLDDFKGKRIGLIGRYFSRWVQPTGAVPVVAPVLRSPCRLACPGPRLGDRGPREARRTRTGPRDRGRQGQGASRSASTKAFALRMIGLMVPWSGRVS